MNNQAHRTEEHNLINKTIGQNLRYIRKLRKVSLQKLAAEMGITYQQISKYEHGTNAVSAYRLYQLGQYLKCKIRYFFDRTYILRMQGYHNRVFHAPIPTDLLDIDKLQEDLQEELAHIDFHEIRKQ
jgi:transcriptional regulator with XRE-family HTH domain